ncbi:NADPH-dependent F420 reductase [Streptomyces luteolus]|uniref:NAD(P)-binding domain-containing protein n=1 Tax=Streptomyces luteolus TaxID=3043615 RepID=A0ABT6SSD5_9ACTN|nr:NAD(P)-binding domain-containing protein [Streptomyces sp. B-S-A12]MDI3418514.1 NAD(P)-binding domain-containing protein [Streptomyces sp. B-S-A12]
MKIGILGSGQIGSTLASLLTTAGHEVAIANSRGPATLTDLVKELGENTRAATVEEAIAFGDPVFLAIPFNRYRDLPADAFAGKVVVDTTNYTPGRDGRYPQLETDATTSSELIAGYLEDARLVKAVNTMNYRPLLTRGLPGGPRAQRLALFVAGDSPEANRLVVELIEQLGFAAIETGALVAGGARQQPGGAVFNVLLHPDDVRLDA